MVQWIVNLSDGEKWLYGIAAAAIITIVGHWIGQRLNHALATRRARRNLLVQESAKFRNAIDINRIEHLREYHLLDALDTGLVPGDGKKFEGEFFKHKRAVHEYGIYLPWFRRFRVNTAWKQYHGGDEDNPDLWQYCNQDDGPELLKKRVEKLRGFGNEK